MRFRCIPIIAFLVSFGCQGRQAQIVHGYIEPPCPAAADEVIAREFFSQGLSFASRTGNTFNLVSNTPICNQNACPTNASISLGRLDSGIYTVNILSAASGQLKSTFEFAVGQQFIDHNGAWSQPSSPGHGVGLFRGGKYVSGSFYSDLLDNKPVWLLLQMANCTSTGYRGALTYYSGNHWSNSQIPAQSNLPPDKTPMILTGIWKFELPKSNEGIFTYVLNGTPIPLGAAGYEATTTVRPMQRLDF